MAALTEHLHKHFIKENSWRDVKMELAGIKFRLEFKDQTVHPF
jgi:hypothetical protein